jgi:hypothetical protein
VGVLCELHQKEHEKAIADLEAKDFLIRCPHGHWLMTAKAIRFSQRTGLGLIMIAGTFLSCKEHPKSN